MIIRKNRYVIKSQAQARFNDLRVFHYVIDRYNAASFGCSTNYLGMKILCDSCNQSFENITNKKKPKKRAKYIMEIIPLLQDLKFEAVTYIESSGYDWSKRPQAIFFDMNDKEYFYSLESNTSNLSKMEQIIDIFRKSRIPRGTTVEL